jgi:hypothetical protein
VFVVVTLLVALGIAAAQGCQGPARGLGGAGGVVQQRQGSVVRADDGSLDGELTAQRYESTPDFVE